MHFIVDRKLLLLLHSYVYSLNTKYNKKDYTTIQYMVYGLDIWYGAWIGTCNTYSSGWMRKDGYEGKHDKLYKIERKMNKSFYMSLEIR